QRAPEDEEELQMQPAVQRAPEDEEEIQTKPASSQTLLRQSGDTEGGFDAGAEVEGQLAAQRGAGRPLPADTRTFMESRFGADFSGVRVHADSGAGQISQQIQAKAFTQGQDIYFGAGQYAPESDAGKRLLAHELTHTIQQTGGVQLRRQALQISHTPTPQVQRLVSRADFVRLAGDASKKGKFNRSTYVKILKALDEYTKVSSNETQKKEVLTKIVNLVNGWLGKRTGKKEKKELRKDMFLEGLRDEAQAELNGEELPTNTPSAAIAFYKSSKEEAEGLESQVNKGVTGAKFKLSIIAAVDHPDYLDFAKKRLELTVSQKKRFWKKGKSNSTLKEEAARHVVETKYGTLTNEQKLEKINELKNIGGEVGHAYVKLGAYDAANKKLSEESFGFWPLKYFPHPQVAIPGRVRHPDTVHDRDPIVRRRDFEVTAEQYKKGMLQATKLMKSPPDYKLIDYNCTKFAREVALAAGVTFPEKAYLRIPFNGLAWDPNSLYHELSKDEQSYNPKEIEDQKQKQLRDLKNVELEMYDQYADKLDPSNVINHITALDALQALAAGQELIYEDNESNGVMEVVYIPEGLFYKIKRKEYDAFMKIVRDAKEAGLP
ncbi:MAG: DUF4157 domain-containing protein, partial [Anaerolineae bacterium]|nr:DUF4157 domain-containing protein [Anaerolineae bacterium]